MIRNEDNGRATHGFRADVVAILTGGSSGSGRDVALVLTSWDWAIVVVYLEHQRTAEATVAELLASGGKVIAVRAKLTDELDVQRIFAESTAAFGGVDVIIHSTNGSASLLYEYAVRHLRPHGAIVSALAADGVTAGLGRRLRERGITVGREPPEGVLPFLDSWRQQPIG